MATALHSTSPRRTALGRFAAAALVVASALFLPSTAKAEPTLVSGTGKGIAGGGLLGAEVVTISMGLAGVKPWWAYLLGSVGGAAAGATGGYFVEQEAGTGQAPVYMLAGGLALIIPAVVVVLNATAFDPGEENDAETVQGSRPDKLRRKAEAKRRQQARNFVPGALVGIDFNASWGRGAPRFAAGVPHVAVQPSYSQTERIRFGATASNDVHVPLVAASF